MKRYAATGRAKILFNVFAFAAFLVGIRVLGLIVGEYGNYFPPSFRSNFLFGREEYFFGVYGSFFFIHIVASPIALVIGFLLILRKKFPRWRSAHRSLGKLQVVLVVVLVVPSGLIMSTRALAGPIAGFGLAMLGFATAFSVIAAAYYARHKQIACHQVWATRCFILLCSPLLLRLFTGAAIVTRVESDLTYQLNAWLSWLIPLIVYEIFRSETVLNASFRSIKFTRSERGVEHDYSSL